MGAIMKIYIVLTHTGTMLSNIIKFYTKCEFSHVSISLDKELEHMYSFGRKNPYNPFWGGFIHEKLEKGTFKRFGNTYSVVYSLNIEERQYEIIKYLINKFNANINKYKFNTIGLFAVAMHIRIKRKKYFYCAEFVKYLLDTSNIKNNLPKLIKPEDFKRLNNIHEIYKGRLSDYKSKLKSENEIIYVQ